MTSGAVVSERGPRLIWWLLPVLAWNLALTPLLPEGYAGDEGVPGGLLMAENGLRVVTFGLLVMLREVPRRRRPGRWAVGIGIAIYLSTWLPLLLEPAAAEHLIPALLPAITPALWLGALAWLGRSWLYALVSALFLAAHITHQLFALAA